MDLQTEWMSSLQRLRAGDYSAWPRHECIRTGRFDSDEFEVTPTFEMPIWSGQENVTVLVNADCGFGDTICYYRWIPQIKANVVLRSDSEFLPLFQIPINRKEDPVAKADYIIHMMAVPKVLGITEVSGESYLWAPKHPPLERMTFDKIGVCWAGNPFNPMDHRRSIPVELFNFWGNYKPFSLVKHESTPDFMLDAKGLLTDWFTTATFLAALDLVITVDTAVAHLAGALGVSTWLLLSEKADWRWGQEKTTPWYNSMRIFRKPSWEDVIEEVKEEIKSTF